MLRALLHRPTLAVTQKGECGMTKLLRNQILPGIFLLVILCFPRFVYSMSSVMQGVTAITGVGLQGK